MLVEKFLFVVRYCVGNLLVCKLVHNCLYECRHNISSWGVDFCYLLRSVSMIAHRFAFG